MELVVREALATHDREYLNSYHNGYTITEVIDKLCEDDSTINIRIIGHMEAVSYVLTPYAAYIIEDGHTVQLNADDLRHIDAVMYLMRKEKEKGRV
ncbi:hypothetical protein [Bacillus subtilis]